MIYDLCRDHDRFMLRCKTLMEKGAMVELTEKTVRSLSQNAYFHVCIGIVAMELGLTLQYVKDNYMKRLVNPALFVDETNDRYMGKVQTLRSSATLTKEEMTLAIDRFRTWAAQEGIFIPEPDDVEQLADAQYQMARMKQYL